MFFVTPFKVLLHNRNLIFDLTRRELESRYKGSFLGRMWIIFNHLSLISIYTFVFGFVFQTRMNTSMGEIGIDFALWLYCGLLPWFFLNESLTITVRDIVSKVNYVKKIVFPLEILPIVTVIVAFINMSIGLLMLFIGLISFGHGVHWINLLYLLIIPPMFLSVAGLSLLISGLGVYFRDLSQLIGLLTMLWMYATPILYNVEMVPEKFSFLFEFNPLSILVEYCRE
jgi:lipopolysaccharide transport system permease protein